MRVLYVHQKKGGFVKNSFDGIAPWPYTPFNENKTTNQAQIKAWMLEKTAGSTSNAYNFVADTWGTEVAQHFGSNEYILVIETVLHLTTSYNTLVTKGNTLRKRKRTQERGYYQ